MKSFILGVSILLISLSSIAQSHVLFDEGFDNNDKRWVVENSDNVYTELSNSEYTIGRRSGTGYNYYFYEIKFNEKLPFEIECTMRHSSGIDNYAYGLVWGGIQPLTFHQFSLTDNGYFMTNHMVKDSYKKETGWTETGSIRQGNRSNTLKIKGDGKKLFYYINGTLVHTTKKIPKQFGPNVGFYVENVQEIKVESLKVKADIEDVDVAPGFEHVKLVNLGKNINTELNDVFPVVSPDGSELYLIRKNDPDNLGTKNKDDIIYSKKEGDQWLPTTRLGAPLNNTGHNVAVGITVGGNSLLLANEYDSEGNIQGEGYSMTHKTMSGWSMPENLDIQDYENENDEFTASLSAGGKKLLMSCRRKGSKGEDLYISFHKHGKKWSKPLNLGSINSTGSESTPYLAPDNKTLYFTSNSYPGYGSADIFVTKRQGSGWTKWSKPLNLGPAINSANWDHYFVIQADGAKAYVVSETSGFGQGDIFEIDLPKEAQPDPVLMLKGKVMDSETNEYVEAEILVDKKPSMDEIAHMWSDPVTGDYEAILPDTGRYEIFAQARGYFAYKKTISSTELKEYSEVIHDLKLAPLTSGQEIKLNNIFFVRSKATILPKSLSELNYLATILEENPTVEITIEGHTDNTGSAGLNLQLSQDRADKIKDYLIEKGITKKRLKAIGYGGTKPVASNAKEETRQLNRRVQFIVK